MPVAWWRAKVSPAKTRSSRGSATFLRSASHDIPTTPPHNTCNGFTDTLNGRAPCSPPDTAASIPANNPGPARDTPQATKAPLHIHPAHHPLRRQLLHPAHNEPPARIQERQGYTECAALEPQFAEATKRGGGRGWKTGRFPCKVRQRVGHGCGEGASGYWNYIGHILTLWV
jgi:hypothetical protein